MSYDNSILQIYLEKIGEQKTSLTFHHEKLSGTRQRNEMKKYWQEVLQAISYSLVLQIIIQKSCVPGTYQ